MPVFISAQTYKDRYYIVSGATNNPEFRNLMYYFVNIEEAVDRDRFWTLFFQPKLAALAPVLAKTIQDTPERVAHELSALNCYLRIKTPFDKNLTTQEIHFLWGEFVVAIAGDRL
jgi:hypothetical protein